MVCPSGYPPVSISCYIVRDTGRLITLHSGTHMTWGVNLGADNITNAVNMAKAIVKAFSSKAVQQSGVQLDLIEIGAWLPEAWRVSADIEHAECRQRGRPLQE